MSEGHQRNRREHQTVIWVTAMAISREICVLAQGLSNRTFCTCLRACGEIVHDIYGCGYTQILAFPSVCLQCVSEHTPSYDKLLHTVACDGDSYMWLNFRVKCRENNLNQVNKACEINFNRKKHEDKPKRMQQNQYLDKQQDAQGAPL